MPLINRKKMILLASTLALVILCFRLIQPAQAEEHAQIPTVAIPTVTGTPVGAIAIVRDNEQGFVNVRSGPSGVYYEIVGMLVEGSQVPALGRSPGGEWIKIVYPGVPGGVAWIWVDLVDVRGNLPIVEVPPTPTPRTTATIDPTLAAQFLVEQLPTRLPTFTVPGPLLRPTFTQVPALGAPGRLPMGLVLIVMVVLGLFGSLISFLRRR